MNTPNSKLRIILSSNWLQMSTASLGGSKIFGEVRVNLKITFPTLDNEALEVRAKPHKLLSQVILHVLQKLQGIFHLTYSRISSYITVGIMIDELDVRDADSNENIHLETIVSTMKTNAITVQKASPWEPLSSIITPREFSLDII